MTLKRIIARRPVSATRGLDGGQPRRDRLARSHPRAEVLEDRRLLASYFQSPVPFTVGAADPSSIQVADFNRDGRADLAVLTSANVSVLLNNGSGGFGAPTTLSLGANQTPKAIAVGDVNQDGQVDILVALLDNTNVLTVKAFISNGGTTFTAAAPVIANTATTLVVISPGPAPIPTPLVIPAAVDPNTTASVAVGDFNGDGKPDLAVAFFAAAGATSSVARVYQGNGDGTFQNGLGFNGSGPLSATPINGTNPLGLTVGDFNRDGAPDLVVFTGAGVSVALNTKTATPFPTTAPSPLPIGTNPNTLATADFNSDGIPDLAVASDSGIDVLLGDGTGKFPATNIVPVGTAAPAARGLAAIDYNRDGRPDLVTFGGDGKLDVLTNTGAPSAAGLFAAPVSYDAGANPTTLAVADINADGQYDLVVGNAGAANNLNVLLGGTDTSGPRVISTQFDYKHGKLTLRLQDDASGLLPSALANAANYKIAVNGKKKGVMTALTIKGVMATPPTTPNGVQMVVVSFQPVNAKKVTGVTIVVSSAAITDRAGNHLDGRYNGAFPSGNGLLPVVDFTQVIAAKKNKTLKM